MSDLYQTNLTDKDKKRCLIRLMEAEDETSVNLEHFFRDRDYEAKKEVTFGNFKNVLEKALPNITRDEVNALFQEFQTPGNSNKANYESFLYRINQYRKKRRALTDILEQMLENFSSKDNTLFDLFEKADKDQNGTLSKKEFLHVLDDFGVYYDADEMEDFFFFLDSSGDNSISYKELNDYFVKFVKKKGKNISELTRSSFFKDPSNYWGRKIFEDAHKYLSQNRLTLTEFFKEEGMETDFSISQFDFTKAMNTLVKNMNDDDLFRLINEMDDKNTKKISIKKFQEVYDAIARDAPNRGDSSPAKKEFEREKRYKDMLKSIAAVISGKHFSYDDFFTKHGYNRHLKTIHEHKFDTALNELDLRLTPDDIRLLKAKLDPDRSGILALDDIFEIKADSSLQTDYIKANLNARETQELKSLLSDFVISTNKRNINLLNEFTRYDFKKEGQLTNDEFVVILKDNQLNIGAQDQDLLIKAFGDVKTRKVNYKAFCEAIQANLNVSQLSQSGVGNQPARYVDPAKVEQKEKELYKGIREQYATLEDLFVAYDRNKDNTISKPEFVQMLKAVKVEMSNDELDAVFDKIDKGKAGKIYFVNMNLAFKPYIEADVKDIISQIIRSFVNDGRSYYEVAKNFPQNASYMKFIDFMDALQSLSKKTNLRDVQFLLSHLNIKLNSQREINWEEFGTALQSTSKRLGVMNDVEEDRVFRKTQRQDSFQRSGSMSPNKKTEAIIDKIKIKLGLNSKEKILDFYRQLDRDNSKTVELAEFKRTVKLLSPNFTDDELNQAFRAFDINERGRFSSADLLERLSAPAQPSSPTNFNVQPVSTSPSKLQENRSASLDIIEKTNWAKEIYLEIRQQLERRGDNFHTYFRVDNHKVNIMEVKMNLNRLDINMNERVSQLLNDLCDEVQPNMINLFYFEKCFNYHKDKFEGENARARSPTDPYQEIREALKKKYLTFEDSFGKYDVGNRGYITSGALRTILEDDLKLYLGSDVVRRIMDQTQDSEGRVSLVKLRDGIGLSRREEPKDDPKNVNIEELLKSLRAAMKNNDLTVDRLFSLFDQSKDGRISWDEFQKFMLKINGSLTRTESVSLFRHIDKYGSGEISQADFRNVFEDAGDRAEKTVQALKDMIKRNRIDTKRAFEMFDRNRNDSIEFSELSEVISNINPDLTLEDKRLIFRRLDVNQDGKITKTEFIKIFGEGVPQSTENRSLRIQRLLDDLKQSMRPRDRNDTERLFAFVDVNRDGKVSPQEFTQFAQSINPSIEKDEAFDMFRIFDNNRDGSISYNEFLTQFNVNHFDFGPRGGRDNRDIRDSRDMRDNRDNRDPYAQDKRDPYAQDRKDPYAQDRKDPYAQDRKDPYAQDRRDPYDNRRDPYAQDTRGGAPVVIERTRWAGEFFEEVAHLLNVEKTSVGDFFFSYDNMMNRADFRKKLDTLGFDLQPDMFDRLTKALANERNPDKIDLNEFYKCFDYYKNQQKVNFNSLKFQRLQQVVRDMKASANKDGLNISRLVESLDKSRYRTCSKSDLEGLLLDKLRLQNNTNIKMLYDHLAQDPEKRTMDLKKLEDLIYDGKGGQRDDPYNRSPDVSFGGQQSGRYDDPYKGSGARPQDPYTFRREDDPYGDQGAYKGARPGEAPRHADVILDRIKGNIEKLGVNIDQIYKRFVPDGADFITYDQFYKGLMNLDQTLTRDEIKTVFNYLDRDNTGKLSKIRFMTALGKIHSNDIPAFLDWAKPFFREVNKHLEDSRSDLSRVMKPHKGLIEKGTFRQGLYVVGVDTDRYSKEIYEVSEILLEGRQEGMNYDVLEACLKRAKEPDAPVWNKKTNFNADEQQKIQKMFQEIAKFMKVDNLSFEQLFLAKDTKKNGWLSEKDMKDVLFNELYVTENPMIDLLIEFCKNDQGNIDLLKFRENLQAGDKVMASVMTLEHFLKELRERFKNDADSVVKFFDANNNKSISRKEFVDCCKNAMNTDKELALFYFSQLDKSNKGEISTAVFKDALEHDVVSGQQIVGKLKDFVVHNRNYILRSFENLDDSRNRSLTISQMKIAFSNAQFSLTIEELTAVIQKLNVRRDGYDRYNYEEFVEKLCNVDPEKENLEEIDNILGKLKAKLIAKNIDLIPIFKKHDVRGDNTISMHDVYEDFAAHDIYLNKHEKDLLVPFLQPVNDRINYYDFSRLIFNGRDKLKTKDQFLREAAWAKDIAILAKDGMRKKNLSTARLFGIREGQEFIPARDFYDGLEYIGIRLNNSEMKRLIELLSKPDRPDQVSITMFEYLIQNIEDVQRSDVQTHTAEEMKIIDQRFAEIRQFMKEDRKTFAQIFPKYDRNNSGFISMNEMKKILDVELGLDITPKLEQFVSLLADRRGMISLDFIRQNTEITGAPGTTGKNVSFANTTQTSQFVSDRPGAQGTQSQYGGTAQTRGGPQQSQQLASSQYPNKQSTTTDPRYQDPRYQDPRTQQQQQQSTSLNPRDMNQTSHPPSLRDVATAGSITNIRRGGQPIEFSGDLIADMKRFFRDRGYTNSERFTFFGGEGKGVIPRVDFISRVKAMEINNLKESAIVSLFEKLDSNRTGQLSENEFRATFDDSEAQYQTREVNVTKEMDEEIYQLFREIDTDHSNTLTIDEVVKSIAKLGANPTTEEVNRLFAELDKNGDGKISYQEFRSVMAVKLKNNILQLEGLLHDLRTEFKRADLNNRGVLSRAQLGQALINLNINLSNQELDALFKEIDRDRSGTIDIDEFIGFIMTPPEKSSFGTEADAALMNIKRSRKLTLMEVLDSFKQMPYNFTQSFTRDLTRRCQNIPSQCIKPKPNSSGVYYSDVLPNLNKTDTSKLQRRTAFTTSRPQVEYDIMTTPSTLAARVTLNLATGVPIPSENSVDRKTSIVGREVRAIIYSKTTKSFISNVISIDVEWDPTFEDRWSFLPSKTSNENALLLRMAEFNQTKEYDTGLTLVFEFIIFYRRERELIEMSTGWADVELNELRKSQILDLKIKGGSPLREININEVDVRANRKGWRNMVKMISKTPVTSKLKIEIKTLAQLSVETREDLEFMPAVTLINRNALGLLKVYRNFLGRTLKEAHEKHQNVDLNNDVLARTFWKAMDCPDTWGNIVFFWNQSVTNVSIRTRDPQIAVEYLKKLLKNLYMMFSNNEYRFNESDPCVRVDYDPNLKDTRRRLLVHYTENALADMQIKQENFRPVPLNPQTSSFKPFHIGELIEDDHDYHTIEQLQSLKSSTGSKY